MRTCVVCFFFLAGGAFGGLRNDDSIGVVVLIDVVGMEGGFLLPGKRLDWTYSPWKLEIFLRRIFAYLSIL